MRIYLDFDSTLVDLVSGWINWLKLEKNIRIMQGDITSWNWISETFGEDVNDYWKIKGIYNTIKPIPGSIEFVTVLKDLYGKENIFIISHSDVTMKKEKELYAEKHYKTLASNFFHAEKKWEYTSDGLLMDDAPHNVLGHTRNNNKPAILFNYRNKYGWATLKSPEKGVTICTDYGKCLQVIDSNKKLLHIEE